MAGGDTLADSVREREGERDLGVDPTLLGGDGAALFDDRASGAQVETGTQLGRYVVLDQLGAGGMGIVYGAWDPQLDRKLALKLLEPRPGSADSSGRARLLREAQAMAQLEHPNVVAIHDVGVVGERVFIAMEYVDGETLRAWLGRSPRSWTEILAVFRAAGEGLAAAHAVGLVHRDFKPDNVMVGRDGRVRVLDFGLARRGDDIEAREGASSSGSGSGALALDTHAGSSLGSLTRTGVLVGTPAYMSPEQFRFDALDARSDQFSFCVALWEALDGQRPHAGDDQATLVEALTQGTRRSFGRREVPTTIVDALARGLAPDPAARWPDMSALLAALEPAPPSRGRWLAVGTGLALTLALGVWVSWPEPEPPAPAVAPVECSVEPERVAAVWAEDRAAALTANFEDSGQSWAAVTATRVGDQLDEWLAGWREASEANCVSYHHRNEISAELFDLRAACLERRLAAVDSLVSLLVESPPTPELVEQASPAVAGLEGLERCRDPQRLRARTELDPAAAAARDAIERAFDHVDQLQMLGRFEQSMAELEAQRPALARLELPELWSVYWQLRALAELYTGELDAALASSTEAVTSARRSGQASETLSAMLGLIRVTLRDERADESARWLAFGEVIGEQLEDPWFRYELDKAHGFAALIADEPAAAVEHFARARDFARAHYGPDSLQHTWELTNVGAAQVRAGVELDQPARTVAGLASLHESLALATRLYSAAHPVALGMHQTLVAQLIHAGHEAEAEAELDAFAAIVDRHHGEDESRRAVVTQLRARLAGE